ncbi:hypothetical protein C8A03DRAFT_18304 [Achaetomium macrosporum]|uniref:Rhodopsin domain-containing protein n=1 Tax=Achaetomium macrosporum TaxID=79813 RepID=A0AAN7C3S8_9PEZI|nr:hypothetical protein C8A03DRAFT_18304 [Achaetomium macrosporum]
MSDSFVTEAFTLLGVGLFIIGLRLYVRISQAGFKRLHADDYLMVVAAVTYSIETYLAYSVGAFWKGLANNGMTDEQRRLLDPNSGEHRLRVNGSKTQVAGWSTYTFLLWTLKAAMCTLYLRLTDGLNYEKRIYAGFVIIVVTWISVLLSILLGCRPLEKNWQIYPDPGNFCQPAISRIDIFVTVVLNVATDLYLMSIPIPMLWNSSLKPLKKAGLILLFSGGVFVTVLTYVVSQDPINGAQQAGSWAVRETFVAVITSNLPMITPLIAHWARPIVGALQSLTSSNKLSKLSGSSRSGNKRGAFVLEDKNPRRGMGPRSVNPIPVTTINGSDEHINPQPADDGRTTSYETDIELGQVAAQSKHGAIIKKTSVEVTESRELEEAGTGQDIGDYYLVRQSKQDAERLAERANACDGRTSSMQGRFDVRF